MARAGLMAAYRDEHEAHKITADELSCMETAISRGFDAHMATMLTRELSRYDIEKAIAFYKTPAGDKFARMFMWAIAERVPSLGIKNEGEEPTLFMEDLVELDNYRKSLKSRAKSDPFQQAFDLLINPNIGDFEREKRRECLPAGKA